MTTANNNNYDIVILGAGIVGLTFASLMAQHTNLSIAIIEGKDLPGAASLDGYDLRVSAITRASENIFRHINVWSAIESMRLAPFQHMYVWDELGGGKIEFDSHDVAEKNIGYIIENSVMRSALIQQLKTHPNVSWYCPAEIRAIEINDRAVEIELTEQQQISTALLVGADGARSWLRDELAFATNTRDYQQQALVTTVKTELAHQHTAWQRFLTQGVLAFLPLADRHHCSIVWSTTAEQAEELLAMQDNEFDEQLGFAFDFQLGKVECVAKRVAFPLIERHAKQYVKPRVALIGDAAHTIHPLAGQGVNLGLLDAASLAQVLSETVVKGRDVGGVTCLRRYERWRHGENNVMIQAMAGFKKIFSQQQPMLVWARSFGLNMTNQLKPAKQFFIKRAMGLTGDLPRCATLPRD